MKRFVRIGSALIVMAFLMAGCSCYNKMSKNSDRIQVTSSPELLSLKGSEVTTDITVTFPAKYFNKSAVLRITPVLSFDGQELAGTPKYLQGEKVKDNYNVITYKYSGSYTQNVSFPFDPRASISTLQLRVEAKCKKGDFEHIATIPAAQGVSMVQSYADWTAYLSIMPDNFRRITTISQEADLVYMINSANLNKAALNTEQVKLFEEFVRDNSDRYRTNLGNVYAKGYASPDGPEKFNDELSQKRSQSGKDAISQQLKDVNAYYDAAAYGEDWEGFQKLVQASDIPDKDLILQVLQMYTSPVQRDQQIKNMSQVYDVLKQDVLPRLRRTQLVATADVQGFTDQELRDHLINNPSNLNVEELLYSATLFNDIDIQERAYRSAAERFDDERAYNNYGVVLAVKGDLNAAKRAFESAAALSSAPEISNNLGAVALAQGDVAQARRYLTALNSTDARNNLALLALAEGDYATAVRGLDGYNLAIAEFCNGNISQSKASLGNIKSGDADYLRAIYAVRSNDPLTAVSYLRSAISQDASLAQRAKRDIEFASLFNDPEFRAL